LLLTTDTEVQRVTDDPRKTVSISDRIVFDGQCSSLRKNGQPPKDAKWLVYLDGSPRWLSQRNYTLLQMLLRPGDPATSAEIATEIGVKFYAVMFRMRHELGFDLVDQCGSLRQYLDIALRTNGYRCVVCGEPLIGPHRIICKKRSCKMERLKQLNEGHDALDKPGTRTSVYDSEYDSGVRRVRYMSLRRYTAEKILRLWSQWRRGKVEFV
jgi:hypothetical protein